MCIIDCLSTIVFILPLHLDYTKVIILILWWRNFQLEYWRTFQLVSTENHELIDFLYDARVLHIIKQSVSSRDTPGIRYNVYSIDYGCYVDLINTSRNPKGLFEVEDENGENDFCKVPQNDYRSIRRAILNMAEFDSHIQKINTR